MAALARSLSLGLNPKKAMFFLLFTAAVLALFFIPELLKLNPLSISRTIDSARSTVVSHLPSIEEPLDNQAQQGASTDLPAVSSSQKTARDVFDGKLISWALLRSEKADAAYTQAATTARALLSKYERMRDVETDEAEIKRVKSSLVAMIAGIDFIRGDASSLISARAAATNLENLDLAVASALASPNLSRQDYIRWMEVSLAPALGSQRAMQMKERMLRPFDPEPRIVELNVTKLDGMADKAGFPITSLNVKAVLRSGDLKKIVLLRNGSFVRTLPFGRSDQEGWSNFYINENSAYGRWTIKVEDKAGNTYEKIYQFMPLLEAYPRDRQRYQLPYTESGLSRKLDKALTMKIKKGDQFADKGFVEF